MSGRKLPARSSLDRSPEGIESPASAYLAPMICGEAFAGADVEVELPSRRLAPMKINSRTIAVTMTIEDAQALEWFMRHLGFVDALRETPPHLGKLVREERAYGIIHAAGRLEEQLRTAGARGDSWMYAS